MRELADRVVDHTLKTLASLALQQQRGAEQRRREVLLLCVHGHYAESGEVAALVAATLGCACVFTGHSLGRNKLDNLLRQGKMTRGEAERVYHLSRRIEAEERALDAADLVLCSRSVRCSLLRPAPSSSCRALRAPSSGHGAAAPLRSSQLAGGLRAVVRLPMTCTPPLPSFW